MMIDNYMVIMEHRGFLITRVKGINMKRIESIKDDVLKQIAVPIKDVSKIINNGVFKKERSKLKEGDIIWKSELNNDKKMVYVHNRVVRKTLEFKNGTIKLLRVLAEGKVDLYLDYSYGNGMDDFSVSYIYYVKKRGEPYAQRYIGGSKSFLSFEGVGEYVKGKRLKYFYDCPAAVAFIQKKNKLAFDDMKELVEIYNANCGNPH